MKYINIKSILSLAFLAIMVASCSESDKVVDQVVAGVQRGAILRQVEVRSNSVALNTDSGLLVDGEKFELDVEYQDNEDGNLLSEMNVYVSFTDNTDDETDNSKAEVLHETLSASDFSTGDRGLPTLTYSLLGTEMLSTLGLAPTALGTGGDAFTVRFELVLTDGRTFSTENNSGTITGSYFRSPFSNNIAVVCAPSVPTPGEWSIETVDSYGDGWNGASLEVVIDGAPAASIANDGATGTGPQVFTFNVPTGTSTISIKYVSGAWDSEVSYTITSANGNDVVVVPGGPVAGVELLDYCKGGL
jgi:hypothetical protein